MKILLINIRYVYVGGPERYLFNIKQILEEKQHTVIPFSIRYPKNEHSEYESFFASPIAGDGAILFKDQKWNVKNFFKTVERNFYSPEVEEKLSDLIESTKPDFAIVLQYLRKLSPAVLVALKRKKIPFIVRLSDYGLVCPSHNLFRGNNICELCTTGNLINSVRYKCVHNSYGASMVNYLATKYHHSRGYFGLIDHFVSPSKALVAKFIHLGWAKDRFSYLPTFANLPEKPAADERERKIMYAGRLEYVKGVHLILEALAYLKQQNNLTVAFKVAGSGSEEYVNKLKNFCEHHELREVEFLGDLKKDLLFNLYGSSLASIIPSLCYDNLPNSALESLALGTPVIGPSHGSFPEFITDGENGFLFRPGDAKDLAKSILTILGKNKHEAMRIKDNAISRVRTDFSPERHYQLLMEIIEKVKSNHQFA
jgi:glycosyltransferase involved in cell wall biosynthesis